MSDKDMKSANESNDLEESAKTNSTKNEVKELNKQISELKKELFELEEKTQSSSDSILQQEHNFQKNSSEFLSSSTKSSEGNINDISSQAMVSNIEEKQLNKNQKEDSKTNISSISSNFSRNELLSNLKTKLDNIDAMLKKARQNSSSENIKKQSGLINATVSSNKEILGKISQKNDDNLSNSISENKKEKKVMLQQVESNSEVLINTKTMNSQCETFQKDTALEKPCLESEKINEKEDYSKVTTLEEANKAVNTQPKNFNYYIIRAKLYIDKKDYVNAEADYRKAIELTESKNIFVLIEIASFYILNNEINKALEICGQILNIDSSNIEALQKRAICYELLKQEDNFFKDVNKAISIEPNNAKSYVVRAEHYMLKQEFQKALEDVNKVIELKSDNASVWYFRGVLYYNLQKYMQCCMDMEKAIYFKTDENEVYRYLGICNFKMGNFIDAIKYLTKSLELGVQDNDVYYYRAQAEFSVSDIDNSIKDISKVIDNDKSNWEYYLLRARSYDMKNLFNYANKDYEKVLKLKSTSEILVERAQFLVKYEKYNQAVKDFSKAIELEEKNAELYKQRGYIYQKLNKLNNAEKDFAKAMKLNPLIDVPIEKNTGMQSQGTTSVATDTPADFQQFAVKTVPSVKENTQDATNKQKLSNVLGVDIDSIFDRANINYRNKKYETALEDLSKIISYDLNCVKAYLLRADIYKKLNNNDKALDDLNKMIELLPSSSIAYFKRAEIYFLQNKEDLALADFIKTVELNKNMGAGYIGIANIYKKRGEKEKAIENYNLAKKYDLKCKKTAESEIKTLS